MGAPRSLLMDGSRIVTADVLAFTTNAETQAATRMPLPAAWSSAVVAVSGLFTTEHPIAFLQRDGPPHRAECSTTRQHPPEWQDSVASSWVRPAGPTAPQG